MTDAKRQLIRHTAAVSCPLSVLATSLDTTAKFESNSSSSWTAVKFSRDGKREVRNKQPVPYSQAQKEDHLAYNEMCVLTSLIVQLAILRLANGPVCYKLQPAGVQPSKEPAGDAAANDSPRLKACLGLLLRHRRPFIN